MTEQPEPEFEYAFESPQTGLLYVTTNDMLAQVMHASRPHTRMYRRPRPTTPWEPITLTESE